MGERATRDLLALAADQVLPAKQASPESSVDKLREILDGAGYELSETRDGNVVEFSLSCPFADRIHPHLGEGATFCPMSQTVLSAIRKKYPNSLVVDNKLVKSGSSFSIKVEE